MEQNLALKKLVLSHCTAAKASLFTEMYDVYRLLSDVSGLAANDDITTIRKYIQNAAKNQRDYRQFVTVKNKDIDIVLERYMLEAGMLNIVVDFDVDPLKNLSPQATISIIHSLERLFSKILDFNSGTKVFFHLKEKESAIHIYADHVAERVFDESVDLTL